MPTRPCGAAALRSPSRPIADVLALMLHHDKAGLPGNAAGRTLQVVGDAPPLSLTWLLSAAHTELVEADRDVADSVHNEHCRLVNGDRRPVGAREVDGQGERVVCVPLVQVEVAPGSGVPGVGDSRDIIGGYYLAGLGERRPHFVAVREVGDVLDQVAGEQGSQSPVEGISG